MSPPFASGSETRPMIHGTRPRPPCCGGALGRPDLRPLSVDPTTLVNSTVERMRLRQSAKLACPLTACSDHTQVRTPDIERGQSTDVQRKSLRHNASRDHCV
jgi:hypothetical protein